MRKFAAFLFIANALAACQSAGVVAPSLIGHERLSAAGFSLASNGAYVCLKSRCGADTSIASANVALEASNSSSLTGEQLVKSGVLNSDGLKKLLQAHEDAKTSDKYQYSTVIVNVKTASIIVGGTKLSNGKIYHFKGIVQIRGNASINTIVVSPSAAHAARYYSLISSY